MTAPETRAALRALAESHGLHGGDQVVFVTAFEAALRSFCANPAATLRALRAMRDTLQPRTTPAVGG